MGRPWPLTPVSTGVKRRSRHNCGQDESPIALLSRVFVPVRGVVEVVHAFADALRSQQAKLNASDGATNDGLGSSVAVSGNTVVAGAPDATVNGHSDQGAAYVFGPLLVGSPQIQSSVDSNPAGTGEAFRYTAVGSGSAGQLSVYLDNTNAATNVIVGPYNNTSAGNPGALLTLLTSGAITKPKAGAWNTVTVPATHVSAGTRYSLLASRACAPQGRDDQFPRPTERHRRPEPNKRADLTNLAAEPLEDRHTIR